MDDFRQSRSPKGRLPGPDASLSDSEVLTLAIFSRWSRFTSERDFYRYAMDHLKDAFPALPERSQFNRLVRSRSRLIEEVASHLAALMGARSCPYEALDRALRDARPGRQEEKGRGVVGRIRRHRMVQSFWDGTRAFACWLPSTPWAS